MGAALNSVATRISARLSDIKARLRNVAEDEGLSIGTIHLDGTQNGKATVTIAKPTVALAQEADVTLLKQVLGDSFPAYFEEKVSYKVRSGALDDMSKIASQDRKDLVMKHVTVKDSTPRVSFHRN